MLAAINVVEEEEEEAVVECRWAVVIRGTSQTNSVASSLWTTIKTLLGWTIFAV
jgi:hypothetical protein